MPLERWAMLSNVDPDIIGMATVLIQLVVIPMLGWLLRVITQLRDEIAQIRTDEQVRATQVEQLQRAERDKEQRLRKLELQRRGLNGQTAHP